MAELRHLGLDLNSQSSYLLRAAQLVLWQGKPRHGEHRERGSDGAESSWLGELCTDQQAWPLLISAEQYLFQTTQESSDVIIKSKCQGTVLNSVQLELTESVGDGGRFLFQGLAEIFLLKNYSEVGAAKTIHKFGLNLA